MINEKKISVVFFGTHNFAATILEGLLNSPFISVDLVITQPDKPSGRKKELQKSKVKLLAEKYNLKIEQPETLKNSKFQIPNSKFQLGIVAQYGLIIPEQIINTPKFGTLNGHTSLLPKYRGASPIQSAIINSEITTGITIMKMDKNLDTGPILLQKEIKIGENDTYQTLEAKMASIGLSALLEAIPLYISGQIQPIPQDNSQATACKQLSRENGKIDWNKTTQEIYNLYRGLYPWPGVWTMFGDKRIKLISLKPSDNPSTSLRASKLGAITIENDKLYIGCKNGSIEILELQPEGKKVMTAREFFNGHKLT